LLVAVVFDILIYMKQHFEETLRVFSDVAKEKVNESLGEIKDKLKKKELEEMVPYVARVDVLELQKEKQKIMDWLHEQILAVDRKEEVRSINKESAGNKDYRVDENMNVEWRGKTIPVTKGDLATDGEWELLYRLDKALPKNVKKEFVVAEAKRAMRDLLDKQIATTEAKREIPKWMDGAMRGYMNAVKGGYSRVEKGKKEDLIDNVYSAGLVAEKLITTQMEKFEIDNNAPYKFYHGDVFDDYERKVDGFLVIPAHTRGVKAKTEDREDFGIQLYVGHDQAQKQHKEEQLIESKRTFGLEDIDDLVLVTIPSTHSQDVYKKWIACGRKPGGPEKLWDDVTQERVFYGILKGFFSEDVIDDMWEGSGKIKQHMEDISGDTKKVIQGKNQLRSMLQELNPSDKVKRKIEKLKQELEELTRRKSNPSSFHQPADYGATREEKNNEIKQQIEKRIKNPVSDRNGTEKTESPMEKLNTADKEVFNKLNPSLKSLLSVPNPSDKVKRKIDTEKQRLKQSLTALFKDPYPSEKTKRKIKEKKQQLELLAQEFSGENKENKTEETDEEKINALKKRIEEGIGNPSGNSLTERKPELQMSKQELERKAQELLHQNSKNGKVKIYTPEEVAEYQEKREPKISNKDEQENLDKFNKKFGKWFGKKK
jgi:hypothetical protein